VDKADWEVVRRCECPPPGFVALSRRNLLTLLHMLDDPDSSKVLHKPTPVGPVMVSPITDEEAYRNRAPGPMSPEREKFIHRMEQAIKEVRVQMRENRNPPLWAYRAAMADADNRGETCGSCEQALSCPTFDDDAVAIAAARDAYFIKAGRSG
jgi:hypothetical protein